MRTVRRSVGVLAGALLLAVATATTVWAQTPVDPSQVPERNDGGWIWWLAWLCVIMGVVLVLFLTVMYMRYAPSFKREDEVSKVVFADRVTPGAELPRRTVDLSQAVPIVVQPPALPSAVAAVSAQASAPAAAAATAAAPAGAAPPPAAEAAPAADASPPSSDAPAEAPAEPAAPTPPAAAPAAPAERVEVTMDQEVFDAKLAELLEAGTDRRVAEGQARRAGMIAARKKAEGEG
jgi:hypothetical protein